MKYTVKYTYIHRKKKPPYYGKTAYCSVIVITKFLTLNQLVNNDY